MKVINGFKEFILRGNVVDLAVGVVIGAAFTGIVTALVKDVITPLIGALGQVPDFSTLFFTLNGSRFMIGDFINALVSFLIVSVTIYFFVVLPVNALVAHTKKNPAPADPTTKKCSECLSDVPKEAQRCAHCTSRIS